MQNCSRSVYVFAVSYHGDLAMLKQRKEEEKRSSSTLYSTYLTYTPLVYSLGLGKKSVFPLNIAALLLIKIKGRAV